jgi:hypothetical protein
MLEALMGWFTKKWDVRLEEILDSIRGRAASVPQPEFLIRDIKLKFNDMTESSLKDLSNSLHLERQGTVAHRRCWRAIALIEKLYFHDPREISKIADMNETVESLQGKMDLFVSTPQHFDFRARPTYQASTASRLAEAMGLKNGYGQLNIICQNSVEKCIHLASANRFKYTYLSNEKAAEKFKGTEVTDIFKIPEDYVVMVYQIPVPSSGNAFTSYSHTMISIGQGKCMGSNNGCIGGPGTFSEINLRLYFDQVQGQNPKLTGKDPTAPKAFNDNIRLSREKEGSRKYVERKLYAKAIAEIVR